MEVTDNKTKEILEAFRQVSAIPRGSKNEAKIAQYLLDWARSHNFNAKKDNVNNVLIEVPGTAGYENSPVVVLQGHMDMVCEKTPDSPHDFTKDPIEIVYEGEWLHANKTTLGADNGIAIAMAMVLALDKEIVHPPLELLFTVDEEQGLVGANALEPGFLKGRILLNLDSEDEGVFTIGCAGGRDTHIQLKNRFKKLDETYKSFILKAGGMRGGHSGVNINEERANAIIILARTLHRIKSKSPVFISSITGGTAHNAIPRDAECTFFILQNFETEANQIVKEMENIFKNEFKNTDADLFLKFEPVQLKRRKAMTGEDSAKKIDLLIALPHGVAAMSTEMKGLVETSNNLASIRTENNLTKIVTSQRSSIMSRLHALTYKVETIARLAGAEATSSKGYPAWQPNVNSPLLARMVNLYKELFGKEPVVESIHAGLECGIIGDKYPGMDMISFGPTIKNPHSPDEKIHIESISKVWKLLTAVLASFK